MVLPRRTISESQDRGCVQTEFTYTQLYIYRILSTQVKQNTSAFYPDAYHPHFRHAICKHSINSLHVIARFRQDDEQTGD